MRKGIQGYLLEKFSSVMIKQKLLLQGVKTLQLSRMLDCPDWLLPQSLQMVKLLLHFHELANVMSQSV